MIRCFTLIISLFATFFTATLYAREEPVNLRVRFDDIFIPPPTRDYVKLQIGRIWDVSCALFPAKSNPPSLLVRTVAADQLPSFSRDRRRNRYILRLPVDLGQNGLSRRNLALVVDATARVLNDRGNDRVAPGEKVTPDWLVAAIMRRSGDELEAQSEEALPMFMPVYPGLAAIASQEIPLPEPSAIVADALMPDENAPYELYMELSDLLLSYYQSTGVSKTKSALGILMRRAMPDSAQSVTFHQSVLGALAPRNEALETVPLTAFANDKIFNGTIHMHAAVAVRHYWLHIRETIAYQPQTTAGSDSAIVDSAGTIDYCSLPQLGERLGKIGNIIAVKAELTEKFHQLRGRSPVSLRDHIASIQNLVNGLNSRNARSFRESLGHAENALRNALVHDGRIQTYLDRIEGKYLSPASACHRERRLLLDFYRERQSAVTRGTLWLDRIENTYYEFRRNEATAD